MLPILAAIGISLLSSVASKAAAALVDRGLGGAAPSDSGASFHSILERSQATTSSRTGPKPVDPFAQAGASGATGSSMVRTPVLSRADGAVPGRAGSGGSALSRDEGPALNRLISEVRNQSSLSPLVVAARPVGHGMAAGYVGRKVAANGSMVTLAGGVVPQLRYQLPRAAASVQIEVRDLHGKLVRTIQLGPQAGGLHLLPFDGRGLQSGGYVYKVMATDARGELLSGVSTASGRVMEVRYEGGQPFLAVGSALVPLAAVYEMSGDQQPAFS